MSKKRKRRFASAKKTRSDRRRLEKIKKGLLVPNTKSEKEEHVKFELKIKPNSRLIKKSYGSCDGQKKKLKKSEIKKTSKSSKSKN